MHTTDLVSATLVATLSRAAIQAPSLDTTAYDALLLPRQTAEESYIDSVCKPNTTDSAAPCQAIIDIESTCQAPLSSSSPSASDYLSHQSCMCDGGFFPNWAGCLNCQYVHGAVSEAEAEAFSSIISSASVSLCTGTPTAGFAQIFSSASNTAVQAVQGAATSTTDLFPSDTAISLYYTASGSQGAGPVSGSSAVSVSASGTVSIASAVGSGTSSAGEASTTVLSGSKTVSSAGTAMSGSQPASKVSTASTTTPESVSASASGTQSVATTGASQTGGAGTVKALGGLAGLVVGGLAAVM